MTNILKYLSNALFSACLMILHAIFQNIGAYLVISIRSNLSFCNLYVPLKVIIEYFTRKYNKRYNILNILITIFIG